VLSAQASCDSSFPRDYRLAPAASHLAKRLAATGNASLRHLRYCWTAHRQNGPLVGKMDRLSEKWTACRKIGPVRVAAYRKD
jgi:hypothetical protein